MGGLSRLDREILSYLADNPNARDTLEGILEWWLLERRIQDQLGRVRESLARLSELGVLISERSADSHTHYRLNRQRLPLVWRLLDED